MASSLDDTGELIEAGTPLTRNHWFDGKFLRADDLARDQDYHREALRLANRAGGFGVVDGLEIGLAGAELLLQPGLGITARGELLLLSGELRVAVDALIAASSSETRMAKPAAKGDASFAPCVALGEADGPAPVDGGLRVYRLTLSRHEALCGHEDVVGALCERACVSERQRPYRLEGVRLRARRINVALAEPKGITLDGRHRRSQIASAMFARDDASPPPLPRPNSLLSPLWCAGAELEADDELTLGILVRGAGGADFVDLWAGRRERLAAQAERYWRRRTRQRPYADFIAQLAQFQCQLYEVFRNAPAPDDGDEPGGDCGSLKALVADLEKQLEAVIAEGEGDGDARAKKSAARAQPLAIDWNQAAGVKVMQRIGRFVELSKPLLKGRADRVLIERGIVELPPAGFLPVRPGADIAPQVQALLGPGVQLKVCSAPLDAIGQLLEQGQHSARTSLLRGIADPADKPLLQIIVPDGAGGAAPAPAAQLPGHALSLHTDPAVLLSVLVRLLQPSKPADGSAGIDLGAEFKRLLDLQQDESSVGDGAARVTGARSLALAARGDPQASGVEAFDGVWIEAEASADPWTTPARQPVRLQLELRLRDRPGAELPTTALIGIQLSLQAELLAGDFRDADEEAQLRQLFATATGKQGGELRPFGIPKGLLQRVIHGQGIPGRADGPGEPHSDPFIVEFGLLWRDGDAALVLLPTAQPGTLLLLERQSPGSDGLQRLRLLVRSQAVAPPVLTHVPPPAPVQLHAISVAGLRFDAGALSAGATPRRAAEAGLDALPAALGSTAPNAAARARLLPALPPAAGIVGALSGPHDWVLFRRPIDVVCGVSAPPPPPPSSAGRYRAVVAGVLGGLRERKQVLDALDSGQLPDAQLATLKSAGLLNFADGAELPDVTQTYLVAQFGRGDFALPCVAAYVLGLSAVDDALDRRRTVAVAGRLGATLTDARPLPTAPAGLKLDPDEGLMLYVCDPADPPSPEPPPPVPAPVPPAPQPQPPAPQPPPPPPPKANRVNVLYLLTRNGSNSVSDSFLRGLSQQLQSATGMQSALSTLATRGRRFDLWMYRAGGTGTITLPNEEQMSYLSARNFLAACGGQGAGEVWSVCNSSANADEQRRVAEESRFVTGQIGGMSNPLLEVRAAGLLLLNGMAVDGLSILVVRDSF